MEKTKNFLNNQNYVNSEILGGNLQYGYNIFYIPLSLTIFSGISFFIYIVIYSLHLQDIYIILVTIIFLYPIIFSSILLSKKLLYFKTKLLLITKPEIILLKGNSGKHCNYIFKIGRISKNKVSYIKNYYGYKHRSFFEIIKK